MTIFVFCQIKFFTIFINTLFGFTLTLESNLINIIVSSVILLRTCSYINIFISIFSCINLALSNH